MARSRVSCLTDLEPSASHPASDERLGAEPAESAQRLPDGLGVGAREYLARTASHDATSRANAIRRLQASVGNASIARLLANARAESPARTRGSRTTASQLAVTMACGAPAAPVAAAGRSGDAMPGAEHGLDPEELEAELLERPTGSPAAAPMPEAPEANGEAALDEASAGIPIRLPDIRAPQAQRAGTTDRLTTWLGYSGTVRNARGGLPPAEDEFGVTWWSDVDLTNITALRLPLVGRFLVKATVEHRITWEVRDREGPTGQADVTSPADPMLTATNYERVADDLTPKTSDLNGRPPREHWWSRGLTERHEQFHANEARDLGEEGVAFALEWLEKQTASTVKDVENLLWNARGRMLAYVGAHTAFPSNEERAYGDGAGEYRALADAIRAKGKSGGYPAG